MATGFMKRISWIVVVLAGVMLAAGLVAAPAFADNSWNVAVAVNDPSKGTVKLYIEGQSEPETTLTVTVENGTEVKLEATLNGDAVNDYYFANWTDEQGNVIKDEGGDVAGPTYTFTVYKDCKLTANFKPKKRITITAASDTWTYDGKPHINNSVAVTSGELEMGDSLSATATGSQTDVGSSDNVVNDGPKVEHGTTDVSYKYVITAQPGTLTVTKAPLTITAKDQTHTYNGQTQGEGDTAYDDAAAIADKVKVEGLQGNDVLTNVTVDGQGQDAGEYDLVPSMAAVGGRTDNYDIAFKSGTLTIERAPLTITTGSATKAYDGKALTNSEASIAGLVNGETATVSATGSQTEVGSSANTYSINWDSAKAENYTMTEKLGTLTVEAAPKKATLTFDLAGGTMDGKTGKVTVKANVGDTVTIPGPPTRKGYTFKYWQGSRYKPGDSYKVVGDHSFTAVWEKVSEPKTPTKQSASQSTPSPLPQTGDPAGAASALLALGSTLAAAGFALRRRNR